MSARYARFLIPLVAFAALVFVFAVGIRRSPDVGKIDSPLVGNAAPSWQLPMLTDTRRTIGSSDLRGRWYLLNVWGTWCASCRDEHDQLLAIQRASQIPIIGIDWMDDDSQALEYLARLGNPYSTVAVDHGGRVAIDWGVYGAPETFLVNPSGVIVYKHIGALTPDVWRREFAARLPPQLASS